MTASELQQLKAEEKMLIGIASKLSDQLNRLKVEELELMSKIRTRNLETVPTETEVKDEEEMSIDNESGKDLDLNPLTINHMQINGDEEEEEEEDLLTSLVNQS